MEKFFKKIPNCVYISPDLIREELSGNVSDQSKNDQVWEIAEQRIISAFNNTQNVVFDATLTHYKSRTFIYDIVNRHNAISSSDNLYYVEFHCLDTPLITALRANAARERVVPDKVIARQYANLEFPKGSENKWISKIEYIVRAHETII